MARNFTSLSEAKTKKKNIIKRKASVHVRLLCVVCLLWRALILPRTFLMRKYDLILFDSDTRFFVCN